MQYSFNLNKVKTMIQFKVYNFLMKEFFKKNKKKFLHGPYDRSGGQH